MVISACIISGVMSDTVPAWVVGGCVPVLVVTVVVFLCRVRCVVLEESWSGEFSQTNTLLYQDFTEYLPSRRLIALLMEYEY